MCEENPRLVGEGLRPGEVARRRKLLELLERGALLAVEIRRHFKDDARVQVARRAAAQRRHSLAAQTEHLAVRRAGGEVELRRALGRRNVDRSAESREDGRDGNVHAEVEPVALEDVALPDSDVNVEIAVLAAEDTENDISKLNR